MTLSNRTLCDEIREYWSDRAASFDQKPGHRIDDGAEMQAWRTLFTRHLGAARGRHLLDLATGTGEIARLCTGLGFEVTGLDWSEEMLKRAREKLPHVPFAQVDAERTMLPDESFDVIVTRHLVWTLVDPDAAFAEWHRLLAPNGVLLVVDGDFVQRNWFARLLDPKTAASQRASSHQEFLNRVHFSNGARADAVTALLSTAGFTEIRVDHNLRAVHRAQARALGWRNSLLRRSEHRYVITARKT